MESAILSRQAIIDSRLSHDLIKFILEDNYWLMEFILPDILSYLRTEDSILPLQKNPSFVKLPYTFFQSNYNYQSEPTMSSGMRRLAEKKNAPSLFILDYKKGR